MTILIVNRELSLLAEAKDGTREVSSALMGEEEFRAFYDRTARPLMLYLARITGDHQIAEDLMQEAFYRFYRAGTEHESESHRRNSLFRIATNLARDAWRRRHGVIDLPINEADAWTEPRAAGERTDLERALRKLRPRQREMLWLAYANGSSHEEIAEVVGVAPGSVKGLLRRARVKLAGLLGAGRATR